MKFNFGTGLMLFFAAWAIGIIYLVSLSSKQNEDLVSEDYYDKGVAYQSRIDDSKNASQLSAQVKVSFLKSDQSILFQFPPDFGTEKITGNIHFYKPDNAALDFDSKIELNDSAALIISAEKMKKGLWHTEISFAANGKNYFSKQSILVN